MGNEHKRQPFPWLALVSIAAVVFIVGSILLPALSRPVSGRRRPADQNYLKQLGIVFKMYSGENNDMFPPMTPYPDLWMFDLKSIYPEYLSDLSILVSPYQPNAEELRVQISTLSTQEPIDWETLTRIAAQSYAYTGWATHGSAELALLIEARRGLDVAQLNDDIVIKGKTFYRLKEGVERHYVTDTANPSAPYEAQAQIPVVISITPSPTSANGNNVLYMDGHAAWVKDFPAAAFRANSPSSQQSATNPK